LIGPKAPPHCTASPLAQTKPRAPAQHSPSTETTPATYAASEAVSASTSASATPTLGWRPLAPHQRGQPSLSPLQLSARAAGPQPSQRRREGKAATFARHTGSHHRQLISTCPTCRRSHLTVVHLTHPPPCDQCSRERTHQSAACCLAYVHHVLSSATGFRRQHGSFCPCRQLPLRQTASDAW
jgi:hypothetical protein